MKRNLEKQLNRLFIKEVCGICLDTFDADEDNIYKITYGDGYACYRCAEETEDEIIKRINKKIDYLKRSREIILK
ncbi:MAG TPA: hypothetical protein VK255_00495 [Patescibacteria group bacterium]|nr:hypothetical protein [Patescibacteria group bacterium]